VTLITLDEARALLLADLPPLGSEAVHLDDAFARTLAEPVVASHAQPAERRATMDGIAVPDSDPVVGTAWTIIGDAPAGAAARPALRGDECIRIATGAMVPDGAARVIPQEIIEFSPDRASLTAPAGHARFVRAVGADFSVGDQLLEAGTRLTPGAIGLAAAANLATITVARKPRVTICTAGDELVNPGQALRSGQSVDSATHAVAALVRCWGGTPDIRPILPDDIDATIAALGALLPKSDVLVCIGGASVGKRDVMRPAAAALGGRFLFEHIAVQPGKPCWHARVGSSGVILGLPGNPTSAFVCAHLLMLPLIDRLMTRRSSALRGAVAATALPANGEREQYLRAAALFDDKGSLWAEALPDQDSGLQAALARAQLLIRRLPHAPPVERGAKLDVLVLSPATTGLT
jgi:molybdopterin molybdotransferase